jgi:hypothetical protein
LRHPDFATYILELEQSTAASGDMTFGFLFEHATSRFGAKRMEVRV